jgi:hypothetical protein
MYCLAASWGSIREGKGGWRGEETVEGGGRRREEEEGGKG